MNTVPEWRLVGDWFDICSCNIPCPCEFAQPPTNNKCEGMLAWHVGEGHFGDVRLDGLNLVAIAGFEGNIWAGAKATLGLFIDEEADERQREALEAIFAGQAGGWPAGFAANIGEMRRGRLVVYGTWHLPRVLDCDDGGDDAAGGHADDCDFRFGTGTA